MFFLRRGFGNSHRVKNTHVVLFHLHSADFFPQKGHLEQLLALVLIWFMFFTSKMMELRLNKA